MISFSNVPLRYLMLVVSVEPIWSLRSWSVKSFGDELLSAPSELFEPTGIPSCIPPYTASKHITHEMALFGGEKKISLKGVLQV
jgi:hypothetical protein